MSESNKKFWNDMGFWQWPCGCAQFDNGPMDVGWEKCKEHEGKLISTDPSIQEEVVDNLTSNLLKGTWQIGEIKAGTGETYKPIWVVLPTDPKERKDLPIASGVLDYFPKALAEVAKVSKRGNDQHNGVDTPLRWDRSKSTDESDALIRHFLERGKIDSDGQRHSAKVAWRALALLEKELEG